MNLIPNKGKIVLKPEEENKEDLQKQGSLYVPSSPGSTTVNCIVVSTCLDSQYEDGDQVIIAKGTGYPITHKNVKYFIMKEEDILCLVKGE